MEIQQDVCILCDGKPFFQEKNGFRFGTDIILLADFIKDFAQENQKNLEIGTGNGILPILLQQRQFVSKEYLAIDILASNIALAQKNWWEHKTEVSSLCIDIKQFQRRNQYKQIFVNPPYMKVDGKLKNQNFEKMIARHEVALTLEELIQHAKKILQPIGSVYLVYRTHRLQELLSLLSKYGFSVSKLQFVYHENTKFSNLVLLEAQKGKKQKCDVLHPRYINIK